MVDAGTCGTEWGLSARAGARLHREHSWGAVELQHLSDPLQPASLVFPFPHPRRVSLHRSSHRGQRSLFSNMPSSGSPCRETERVILGPGVPRQPTLALPHGGHGCDCTKDSLAFCPPRAEKPGPRCTPRQEQSPRGRGWDCARRHGRRRMLMGTGKTQRSEQVSRLKTRVADGLNHGSAAGQTWVPGWQLTARPQKII